MRKVIGFIAVAVLLLAASSARAQGFPNTYTGTATVSYDPAHGAVDPARGKTPGTITVTVTFRGATQGTTMNQSGIQHHPYPFVKLGPKGGSTTNQGYIGPGFLPNTDMGGWNHVFTFDLQNSGCDFQVLETGGCELDNEPQIQCPIHGFFAIPWTKLQIIQAITTSQIIPSSRYWNGAHYIFDAEPQCPSDSTPPDWSGPSDFFDDEPFGNPFTPNPGNLLWARSADVCWRTSLIGLDFFGTFECYNTPRNNGFADFFLLMERVVGPGDECTKTDKNIKPSF